MTAAVIIKGVLIDPVNRTVSEVELSNENLLASMYKVLGCACVDVGREGLTFLPSKPYDDLWFDDEGLYSECEDCFELPGMVPLIGRGLILSYDADGNSISHTLTQEDICKLRSVVTWSKRLR